MCKNNKYLAKREHFQTESRYLKRIIIIYQHLLRLLCMDKWKNNYLYTRFYHIMKQSILITGAGGFIGSYLVERALEEGWEVWAGVRKSTSRTWLTDERIHFIDLPYHDRGALSQLLKKHQNSHGAWDVIINNMGVTKTNNPEDFDRINYHYVREFVTTLREVGMLPRHFVLMSSLSAFGPTRDPDKGPISLEDDQIPNTYYGESKLKVARFIKGQSDLPYTIFYPTGVYGPREKDYYLMFKTVRSGIDFIPGFKPQRITFIYVKDLVEAVFRAIERKAFCKEYIISEGRSYSSSDFRRYIQQSMGKKHVFSLPVPLFLLKAVNYTAGWLASMAGKVSTLNKDKYHIMAQRNWECDIHPLEADLDFMPQYSLERGVQETYEWYKAQKWL